MSKVVSSQQEVLPLLPLRGIVLFPHAVMPLEIGRERSVLAVEEALRNKGRIVLAAQKDPKQDVPRRDDIYDVGVLAVVRQSLKLPGGQYKTLVEGLKRVRIHVQQKDPFFAVQIVDVEHEQDEEEAQQLPALVQAVLRQFEKYVGMNRNISSEVLVGLKTIDDPSHLADAMAAHIQMNLAKRQELLEFVNPAQRLERIAEFLVEEMAILDIERRIQGRVRSQMEKNQREFYLREQVKAIQEELGDTDGRTAEIQELRKQFEQTKLPQEVKKRVKQELERFERMPPGSAETVVSRTYLDWMLHMPWYKETRDTSDIDHAKKVLDADHFGLKQVKERILEFLAVRQLTKKVKGPILCLVGPPGVGKTSLARSVAKSLGRKFVRFSLGGVRDEAEIRGHRRTYVGALPGKVIQSLRQAGTRNPVILLDEIDKMSMDFRGDPSAALLEVLDPEQNDSFADHYLEVPFDLSDVFFITTANVLPAIPPALRDRLEVIRISGYTEEEKLGIARHHIVPRQIENHGLEKQAISISDNALRTIIRGYTREAGVRQLERNIATICRKTALAVVREKEKSKRITKTSVRAYLGKPRYRYNEIEEEDRIGTATGLAYTQVGGDILNIEVSVVKGKGNLTLTGKLGDVMRESARAAFSYIRSRHEQLGLDANFYQNTDIHIHVPEGAIPKDGPSAGIAIGVALASALTGRYVSRHVAMTGEITLRGNILPIGGVKEKVLAAHRAGIQTVVLPRENEHELDDIPSTVRNDLTFRLVSHMDEALFHALVTPTVAVEKESAATQDHVPFLSQQKIDDTWVEESPQ